MSHLMRSRSQQSFAEAVSRTLRESRRRQKLTQAELAQRTGGLVSKAALANYETGHRSLRVDVLWIIAGALGEDLGALMTAAQTDLLPASAPSAINVDVPALLASNNPKLAPVRRWFELRQETALSLDGEAIAALAALMDVNELECRRILRRPNASASVQPNRPK